MQKMVNSHLKEVFRTDSGCVYQCDKTYSFVVDFAGHTTTFKVVCFFALKKLVDRVDLEKMVLNPEKSSDIEIISPCGCERVYVLSLSQIIQFRELLCGTKAMLELNSIIRERINSVTA